MAGIRKALLTGTSLCALAIVILLPAHNAASQQPQESAPATGASDVPAYHSQVPKGELTPTMDPDNFTEPVIKNAYVLASKVKKVLYQEPCYCHCDRSAGHQSLLDCFASKHGSMCGTCMREDFFAYEQTKAGKTPAQIREAIIRGDWQKVDVQKYTQPAEGK